MSKRHPALIEWLKSASDLQVSKTGTTRAYLRQIGYGHKTPSVEHAARIEGATGGLILREALRPDDWQVMWPELIGQPARRSVAHRTCSRRKQSAS